VVQALTLMALTNPRITATLIEGGTFQQEVDSRNVMAVPVTFLNGEMFASGKMGVEEILAKLDTGASARAAAKIAEKEPMDVLVVGGGPAGASAAIYTARKGFSTGIAAERFGGQVLDTMGIENFISVPYTEGPKLASQLESHVGEYEIDVMNLQQATKLIPASETGGYHEVVLENGASLKARTVILSTGARWRNLGVPGEFEYRNRGVAYCPHCDGPLFKGKRVAVVGGGNSGVEAAIDLAGIVGHVTLIEFDSKLRADEVLQDKLRLMPNVDILMNAQTTEITGDGERVSGLSYKDRVSGEERQVALDGVFVQIGLVPNTEWLKGSGLELSKFGEIAIDERTATNLPGIFAAGDCTTVPYKQIIIAMGEGSKAALSAFDFLIRNPAPAALAVETA
jgi:alkyl hydroperoxide reductase subunit F